MKAAVRFYSRSGHTKMLADALAEAVGVKAVSVDSPEAPLGEKADVLFIGGALYAYGIDRHLKKYLSSLDASKVGRAVVFSSASLSRHALDLIRKALEEKGIPVEDEMFFVKGKPDTSDLADAKKFAAEILG